MEADALEVIWTLVALAGAGFSWSNLHITCKQVRVARTTGNGVRLFVAQANRRREAYRLAKLGFALAAGVAAMFRPASPEPWSLGRVFLVGCILALIVLITLASADDRVFRARLGAHLAKDAEGGRA